jgi:hypothetical protein
VVELAANAWKSKLEQRHERECDRLRKENRKRKDEGKTPLPIPDFTDWDAARVTKRSAGIPLLSGGKPPELRQQAHGIPPENALKGREGKGSKGKGEELTKSASELPADHSGGNEKQPPDAPLTLEQAQQLQATYPVGIYRQAEWVVAEKLINGHLANGIAFDRILASFERYRAQITAREKTGTEYVLSPVKHCDREHPLFDEPFPIPRTKAEARQDANIDAGQQWLEESTRAAR